ncbi:fasciclin domain-containing protein [Actinokineospora diospyrosa]|uniref:Uncaracterized surface protein containing fasciclin (FAS1) repeats n=1 Tax=Actinokineospora diospyrosa TaxID=103728 RepID=A0ABT1IHP6_9PSEU|nr:fasciclin domain-containing protein [Actinokineospora diospyrosa]MCP2272160.1 Uncaracterized surface protein containing fasciclin (FAS1) repeats [Actinokineospora diospyrosa]
MSKLKPVLGVVLVALSLAACSSNETGSSSSSAPAAATTTTAAQMGAAAAASDGVTTAADVFGGSCKALPQGDAAGGLTAMGPQPVATAASTNPLLTKLVAAVQAIPGLVDTLNTTDNLTVFAPADSAFAALGDAKFQELAQNPAALAPILQFHVVAKRYDKAGLLAAKTVKSLNAAGGDITIAGSGDDITVNGAKVLCGNIPTKNATVFVIDTVLTPKA